MLDFLVCQEQHEVACASHVLCVCHSCKFKSIILLPCYRSMVPGKVQLGPEGCKSTRQIATIIQSNLFSDSAALVHVVSRVLIPLGLDKAP